MKYSSAYLWEKGSSEERTPISIFLQQACVRKRRVLFACVCEGRNRDELGITESGYFTEGLVEWFHREGLRYCNKRMEPEALKKILEKEVKRILGEVQAYMKKLGGASDVHYRGILLWENYFLVFVQGEGNFCLLNRRFQKKNFRCVPVEVHEGMGWMHGCVQHKVGILLCTAVGFKNLSEEEIVEVLLTEGEPDEERMEKRLRELWQENVRRGEDGPFGAVFIRT